MIPKTKTFTLTGPAHELLNNMECRRHNSGFVNYMKPPAELVRPVIYDEAKKALVMLGGEWKSGPGAFFFKDNVLHFDALTEILATGVVANKRQSTQFFPTPKDLAARIAHLVVKHLASNRSPRVLEPSAGDGALIDALIEHGISAHSIDACEMQSAGVQLIKFNYPHMNIVCNDFGKVTPTTEYDAVVMNPPFAGKLWQDHILHACKFLDHGGIIVAVVPRTATLNFLPNRVKAKLTPVKAEFEHTGIKVSILTINVSARAIQGAFAPIIDLSGGGECPKPLRSPGYYLKLIRRDMAEVEKNMNEIEAILGNCLVMED